MSAWYLEWIFTLGFLAGFGAAACSYLSIRAIRTFRGWIYFEVNSMSKPRKFARLVWGIRWVQSKLGCKISYCCPADIHGYIHDPRVRIHPRFFKGRYAAGTEHALRMARQGKEV